MSKDKKHKISTINGAIYLKPGLYELGSDFPNVYLPIGYWPKGTHFIIEYHIEKFDEQEDFEYLTARLEKNEKYLVATYDSFQWNVLATRLIAANTT